MLFFFPFLCIYFAGSDKGLKSPFICMHLGYYRVGKHGLFGKQETDDLGLGPHSNARLKPRGHFLFACQQGILRLLACCYSLSFALTLQEMSQNRTRGGE